MGGIKRHTVIILENTSLLKESGGEKVLSAERLFCNYVIDQTRGRESNGVLSRRPQAAKRTPT